ncbi:hypothetical protein [Amycolatopsis sp. NPDC004169]|uniref:hypothetical protein n=1 Tax=Amycolatopsis sp. NPDC004169 TaxID=3154453 RepID=UPI0033ACD307
MSANRVVFAAVLVAASWTTVISGLVAVGAARAEAAWLKSGSGSGYAAGLQLQTPDQPVLDSAKCNNGNGSGPSAKLHWSYPAPLPPGFELFTATTQGGPASLAGTATTNSATIPLPGNNKVYVSVRATAGSWKGTRSPEVAAC